MTDNTVFVDTNILVYAHDSKAGARHAAAIRLIRSLWDRELFPTISVQVLNEFYATLIRKDIDKDLAYAIVKEYTAWDVVPHDSKLFCQAASLHSRWQLSFWDSLILAAAKRARIAEIWSEDFSNEQDYDGVRVVNPLK